MHDYLKTCAKAHSERARFSTQMHQKNHLLAGLPSPRPSGEGGPRLPSWTWAGDRQDGKEREEGEGEKREKKM